MVSAGQASGPSAAGELRAARAALVGDGRSGAALRDALVGLYDSWLAEVVAAAAGAGPDVALVAVGGLGRREPAPYCDLDLVLVHGGRAGVTAIADAVWYPVWDAGVGLDHSVRTVAEALRGRPGRPQGRARPARRCGTWPATRRCPASCTPARTRPWRQAAPRRGCPSCARPPWPAGVPPVSWRFLLEPDLKESRGGLRDVHALHALAAAQLLDLPGPAVVTARDVLLDARGELHTPGRPGAGPAGAAGAGRRSPPRSA